MSSSESREMDRNKPEWLMVSQTKKGDTFYPRTIPKNRNKWSIFGTEIFIALCFFFADFLFYQNLSHLIEAYCYGMFVQILVELICRVNLFVEEYQHLRSRYTRTNGRWTILPIFNHIFYFSVPSRLMFLLSLFICVIFWMKHGFIEVNNWNTTSLGLKFIGLSLLRRVMFLESAPIYDSLRMEVNNGLNYGSGMAYSFFYGYLKRVLGKACNKDESIAEKIEDYIDTHKGDFPTKKLLILIPKSAECPTSLKNGNSIEDCLSLSEKIENVAGVKNRVYKNSVYKIYDSKKNKKICACVEYASPLATFQKGLKANGPHTESYKSHKEDIILQFYLTLKDLVRNDSEISESCDLIFFDDKDENGDTIDVTPLILKRISILKSESRKSK